MRRITTAITAAALALSVLAQAVPAAALTPGYDSAYAGESAFVNINAGETRNFQVFFANTGTVTWVRGTGTQVDLAACLEDKVTCNAQDASEASWNSGWLSPTRYTSTVQTSTPPGSLATFSYNIMAPAGVAAGIFRFNGDLVVASTGDRIHPEGYYQEANTGTGSGGAPTITSLTPNTGSANGGTDVVIAGTGFVCNPTFPTVSFGGTNGTVLSCGASSITVDSPAHAPGAVTVTVANPGTGPSNGLTFTFADTTRPTFTGFTASANLVTVTFSEPVCSDTLATNTAAADWSVLNVSAQATNPVLSDSIPDCNAARDNGVTTAVLQLTNPLPNGSFVETTLNAVPAGGTTNQNIEDAANNLAAAPQARQATATAPETTAPTITSVTGAVGATSITINFSEPVRCDGGGGLTFGPEDITLDDSASTADPSVTGIGSNACGTGATGADSSFSVNLNMALPADRTYTVTLTPEADQLQDIVGNDLANPSSITFVTGASDFTPPTMIDARMANNLITTNFSDPGDSFNVTFSETMNGSTTGTISIQDQDGTTATITCSTTTGTDLAACTWNTAVTTMTVTLSAGLTLGAAPGGPGTTPGMQIPFNITALNGINDLQGNPSNVLGSSDRLVDFE